ncbi:hypothetical protein [Thiomicrorhabdus chilensis]|nr:hypothetical protein [Thiomicrorhabdus chilensis]
MYRLNPNSAKNEQACLFYQSKKPHPHQIKIRQSLNVIRQPIKAIK